MFAFTIGLTPQDAASEIMGMAHCGAGIDWLMGTTLPNAFFALGMIIVVKRCVTQKNPWLMFNYFFGVLLMVALFVWGRVGVDPGSAVSGREAAGAKVKSTTAEIAKAKGVGNGSVSAGFIVIVRGMDELIRNFTIKIEEISLRGDATGKGLYSTPMEYIRTYVMINTLAIDNPNTRNQFLKFQADCFTPALPKLQNESPEEYEAVVKDMGPWNEYLVKMYRTMTCTRDGVDKKCYDEWVDLKNKVKLEWDKKNEKLQETSGKKQIMSSDDMIKMIFKQTETPDFQAKVKQRIAKGRGLVGVIKSDTGTFKQRLGTWMGGKLSRYGMTFGGMTAYATLPVIIGGGALIAAHVLPLMRGFLLMTAYSAFPLIFLMALLPDCWVAIKNFFTVIYWLKIWTLVWSLINIFQIYYGGMLIAMGGEGQGYLGPFANSVVFPLTMFLALTLSPVIAGFIVWGTLQGIAGIGGMVKGPLIMPK